MNDVGDERKITLTFDGEAAAGGRVPLTVLASKLQALQSLLYHAAATVEHDRQARRGQWANRYRNAVELRFADAREGSLTIEAELSRPDAGLFDGRDVGLAAVDLTYGVASALERDDYRALTDRVGDRQERMLLLRQFESLAPRDGEAYTLTLGNGSATHPAVLMTGTTRLKAQLLLYRDMIDEAGDLEEAQVVGTLTKIHYEVQPEMLSVRVDKGYEVACYYDASLRDTVSGLCAGSTVEVKGFGTMSRGGRLKQVDIVTGIEAVSMDAIRIARFEHGGRRYALNRPLSFDIEFIDGVWSYRDPELGIRGYARQRAEALRLVHVDFDYAYREFAEERDEALDAGARALKAQLLGLVKSLEGKGGGD